MSPTGWKVSNTPLGNCGSRINSSRKKEVDGPKRKQLSVVDVSGGASKAQSCKKNTAQEPGMLGPSINVNWMLSSSTWQDGTLTPYESVN